MVVSMCSEKILSRLRLTTRQGKEPRQHPKLRFQKVIHALASHTTTTSFNLATVPNEEINMFIERAKEIVALIDTYTNHPRPQQLEDLIDGLYRLRKVDCQAVLNTIPDDRIQESNKKSTLNTIHKVARYAEAARFLFRTSKRFSIARRMQVEVVSLPDDAFFRAPVDPEYAVSVSSMLQRIRAPHRTKRMTQKSQTNTLCLLIDTSPSKADDDLTKQARRTHVTGKLHAEVQLVLHCEILEKFKPSNNRLPLPPRIVCSSKKACFLCDLYIKMHGKMQTPWSHGKLYPGWWLPECSALDLQLRFIHLLEDRLRDSIVLLFERRERTSYPGPSESTLITLPSLASETGSALLPRDDDEDQSGDIQAEGIETVDENDNQEVTDDNNGPKSSSEPLSSVLDISVSRDTSGEDHERGKSDAESQHELSNLSCRTDKIAKRGSQKMEGVVKEHSPYAELEREAQSAQSASSPKDSDHVNYVKQDDHVAEDEDLSSIIDDPVKPLDLDEERSQSPKPCEDSGKSLEAYYHMRQGQRLSQTIRPKHTKTFFTSSLVLQLEYSTASGLNARGGTQPHKLPFSIERAGVDEVAKLKDDGTLPIGNAEAMIGEIPITLPSMDRLCVAAGGVVFKITFQ
ncbi:hypothetical protein F5883DRAFT_585381 [Diaporthe sp. PMI_573]|nr:hypothetical protein F5883DRAFT_585381 [Diaporthaceae sp. PMI_573]